MNILVVVPAEFLFLLDTPAPDRLLDVSIFILAAHHEADLPARIRRDGGVCVFDGGEDFFAGLFQVCDEGEVEPLVLSCIATSRSAWCQTIESARYAVQEAGWEVKQQDEQPCVVITPPSFKAPDSNSK